MRNFKIMQKVLIERGHFHYHQFYDTRKNVIDVDASTEDDEKVKEDYDEELDEDDDQERVLEKHRGKRRQHSNDLNKAI